MSSENFYLCLKILTTVICSAICLASNTSMFWYFAITWHSQRAPWIGASLQTLSATEALLPEMAGNCTSLSFTLDTCMSFKVAEKPLEDHSAKQTVGSVSPFRLPLCKVLVISAGWPGKFKASWTASVRKYSWSQLCPYLYWNPTLSDILCCICHGLMSCMSHACMQQAELDLFSAFECLDQRSLVRLGKYHI